jgi:hypothetical protein
MKKSFVYRNPRPALVVESTGGRQLGRCYHESTYRVTSRDKLSKKRLQALFEAGFLGVGQEFFVVSPCDGTEAPAGEDLVPCVVIADSGETLDEPAINPYSGKPYPPAPHHYFVYECRTRCDSGD